MEAFPIFLMLFCFTIINLSHALAETELPGMKLGRNLERNIQLDCGVGEGFRKYSSLKLPDTRQSWFERNMTMKKCEAKCRTECNCTAYTTLDIKNDTGCLLWYDELIDIITFHNDGKDIFIRRGALEIEKDQTVSKSKKKVTFIVIIVVVIIGIAILLGLCLWIAMKSKRKLKANGMLAPHPQDSVLDIPLFDLPTLSRATNNFSDNNKLGEGGFGTVYKGLLDDGREVAVKRLSRRSAQGVKEFNNEVILTSQLQHRNLVKILGCSIHEEEKLLVYEWMPNKGLDLFLFHETEMNSLSWSQRFHIINGVARGLLYLHQDSIYTTDHPSRSDPVMLERGYMSPEYAGKGIFSVKSDIFSFGVLVLEILSGKKNRQFFHHAQSHNLLGHAWILYKEGRSMDLVDESLIKSLVTCEVLRSIHVALLCVQKCPEDRPDMCMVVMMLSSEYHLPEPRQPGFFTEDDKFGLENSSSMQTKISYNNVTITHPDPR